MATSSAEAQEIILGLRQLRREDIPERFRRLLLSEDLIILTRHPQVASAGEHTPSTAAPLWSPDPNIFPERYLDVKGTARAILHR